MGILHTQAASIGDFSGVMQIAASFEMHKRLMAENAEDNDLLSNGPANPPPLAGGDLTYHGGPVIDGGRAKVFNVYLGAMDFDTVDFDLFTKAITENGYYLSPDGRDASNGKFLGSMKVAWPFPSKTVDDSAISAWVDQMVGSQVLPGQDGFTNYALIFPVGTTVTAFGGQASCSVFCGYHTMTRSGNYYQVINDAACSGCNPGVPNEGRMMVQAHEIAEWRSDPQGNGWYNNGNQQENADECAWNRIPWGPAGKGWVVQPFWVNGRGCYTGPYVEPGPPPPPPPPPAPKTVAMRVSVQPAGGVVNIKLADFAVELLDSNGNVNTTDSTTIVTSHLKDAAGVLYKNTQSPTAKNGVVSFVGDTMQNPHTRMQIGRAHV